MLGTPPDGLIGKRYQLHEKLGEGGMGAVYRATDRLTGQIVALKRVLMLDDTAALATHSDTVDFRLTLAQEFKVLASMRHPHIISVLDYGFHGKHPYVTMELVEQSRSFIDAGQDATLERQIQLLIELLQALAYLHRRDILHHDLKPGNVLVTRAGQVKVLDFGLAAELGQKQEISGTLAYMAPELLMEEPPTNAADLYAVGVMAYELLAGQHPFDLSSMIALINEVMSKTPNLALMTQHFNEDTDDEERARYAKIVAVINRLLAKDPHERYSDAYVVIQDLCEAMGQNIPQESAAIRESYLQAAVFVGREQELEQLHSALLTAEQKRGSAWLIGGESGVGKTRLLEELRVRALVQGITVLQGQAVAEGGLPYQLWRAPLRRLILTSEIDDVDAGVLKDLVPEIDSLLGYAVSDAPTVEGAAYQQRLVGTVVRIFQGQTQPVVLLLEDVHWANESLDVLRVLGGIVSELPILIVASYRHEERPQMSDELPNMQFMRLERFQREHISALSISMLGEAGNQQNLIDLLNRETEGNVYFLIEVVRVLAEEAGRLSEVGRKMLPERVLAGGIQNIIQRRLARVPQEGRALLELAAIAGRELDLDILRRCNPSTNVEEWLTICSNCAVLESFDGKWRFAHDKLRLATMESVSAERARDAHTQIARAVEAVYPDSSEHANLLAYHWRGAGDKAKELLYAKQAGEYALRINNFTEAIEHLERSLELLPEAAPTDIDIRSMHDDLLINLGEALQYTGDYVNATSRVQEGLALAREINEQPDAAKALVLLGDLAWRQGKYDEAKSACEEGLALYRVVGDQRGAAKALNRIGTLFQEQGNYPEANQHFTESLTVAEADQDLQGMTDAINNLGVTAFRQGNAQEAASYFERTLAIARTTGERRKAAAALLNLSSAAGIQNDFERAQSYLEETLDICRSIGERRGVALAMHNLGRIAFDRQDYTAAVTRLEESLAISRSIGNRPGEALTLSQLGDVMRMIGDASEANAIYRQALVVSEQIGAVPTILDVLVGISELSQTPKETLTWLGSVIEHPAASDGIRERANAIIERLREELPKAELDVRLEQGKARDLMEVVRELLDAPSPT